MILRTHPIRRKSASRGLVVKNLGRLRFMAVVAALMATYVAASCLGQPPESGMNAQETIGFRGDTFLLVDPGEPVDSTSFNLELLGVDPGRPYRVLVANTEGECAIIEKENSTGLRVKVDLKGLQLKPGSYGITVEQGYQKYSRGRAFHVVQRPLLEGAVCGSEEPLIVGNDHITMEAPSQFRWIVKVGDNQPPLAGGSGERYNIDLSSIVDASFELAIKVETTEICRQRIQRSVEELKIDLSTLTYDPAQNTIGLHLEGAALPKELEARFQPENGDETSLDLIATGGGHARARDYRAELTLAPDSCMKMALHHSGNVVNSVSGRWESASQNWRFFKSCTEARLADLGEELIPLARIELAGAVYEFVKIRTRSYFLGLTDEQRVHPLLAERNLANPSSKPGGMVEVTLARPFLMGVHEVTNGQFHSYLRNTEVMEAEVPEDLRPYRSKELPDELVNLPVTQVSYVAARRYASWLLENLAKESDRWRVRLPHEIEWEMAARGGDRADYAFRDRRVEDGLASLDHERRREVGSNSLDRSIAGLYDITGNVREMTQTIYEERLLELLDFHLNSGEFNSWDPAQPYAALFREIPDEKLDNGSGTITVRGAANNEGHALFYLLSIRRQIEMSDNLNEKVGFRLVLVPTEGS